MEGFQEVLTFEVEITGHETVKGKNGEATMILFEGNADCENFHGKILPGGVDTQVEWPGQNRTLSARYILEGVDKEGQSCRIFVENNGIALKEGEISTTPRIITDSEALSYLEQEELFGTITPTEKGVTIHIFLRHSMLF